MNYRVDGDKLIIEADISQVARDNAPLSSTGKTKLVASSHGSVRFAPGLAFSLNVTAATK